MKHILAQVHARLQTAGSDDVQHREVQKTTGFWGARGAGALILCPRTKRFLLAYRSAEVQEPHTWGTWGGAVDKSEDVEDAVRREVAEETGYKGKFDLQPLYVFQRGTFRYYNFLVLVPKEFKPRLDWETDDSRWCELRQFPKPLHFGLQALINDGPSMKIINRALEGT